MRIKIKPFFLLAFTAMTGLVTYVGRPALSNPPDHQDIVESSEDTNSNESSYDAALQNPSTLVANLNNRVSQVSYPDYSGGGETDRYVQTEHSQNNSAGFLSKYEFTKKTLRSNSKKLGTRGQPSFSPYSEMLKGFIQAREQGKAVDTKKLFSEIVSQQEAYSDQENNSAIQKTAAKDKTTEEEVYETVSDPYGYELEDFAPGPGTLDTKSTVLSKIGSPQDAPVSKTDEGMDITEKVLSLGSEGSLELSTRPNEFVIDAKGADLVIYPYKASNSVESVNIYVVDDKDQRRSYGRVVAMGQPIFIDLESLGLKKIKGLVVVDARKINEERKSFFRSTPDANHSFAFDIDSVAFLHIARRKNLNNSINKPLKG